MNRRLNNIIDRTRILIEYDTSKTLKENINLIEQDDEIKDKLGTEEIPKWYLDREQQPEEQGFGTAMMDILASSNPITAANISSIPGTSANQTLDALSKDKEERGADRMTDEERKKLFYIVPLPPNRMGKKYLMIPKLWDDYSKTYEGTKNTYSLFGSKPIEEEFKSFGIDKWKGTGWENWIPSEKKWREMFPPGTLRALWIGDKRFQTQIKLPEPAENTTGDDFYFDWYTDNDGVPYDEKNYMDPLGKNPFTKKFATPWWENPHAILPIIQIALSFFPPVGPIIAGGLGLIDAGLYFEQDRNYEGGLAVLFSLLPGVLQLPGVKQLGSAGMKQLGSKLSKFLPQGANQIPKESLKNFTNEELKALEEMVEILTKNPESVIEPLNKQIAETLKKVAQNETNSVLKTSAQKMSTKQAIVRGTKGLVSGIAPYAGAYYGYHKTYKALEPKFSMKAKVEKEGFNWEDVKRAFFSDGSEKDNNLLSQAWDKGWRPEKEIPKEFQTETLKNAMKES